MKPDPKYFQDKKLAKAMKEVKRVLHKHDIAGVAFLHTPGSGEFLMHLDPSYSCVKIMPNGEGVRFRAKAADYDGDKHKLQKVKAESANMLRLLADMMSLQTVNMLELADTFDKITDAEHGGRSDN